MALKISKANSFFIIDLHHGAKLLDLVLSTKDGLVMQIVKGEKTDVNTFCSDGNYLMYPWVNRLHSEIINIDNKQIQIEPLFRDKNNLCIHGLFAMRKRVIIDQGQDFVKVRPEEYDQRFPQFTETFKLENEQCFSVTIELNKISNQSDNMKAFGFGYHPYIQLGESKIDDLQLKTNLDQSIQVDEKLLPIGDQLKLQNIAGLLPEDKIGNLFLDNGFTKCQIDEDGVYVQLIDNVKKCGVQVKYHHKNEFQPLKFWQMYTPPDRQRIAIEPQTCCTDAFRIENSGLKLLNPGETTQSSYTIELI